MTQASHSLRILLFSVVAFCFFWTALPSSSQAATQEMRLTSFKLTEAAGNLEVKFGVAVTELDQLRILLKEGAKVELNCQVTLTKPRSYWFRKTLSEATLTSTLHFDTLTKEYFLTLSNEDAPHRHKSLMKLLDGAWKHMSLPVGSQSKMSTGNEYRVTLDVEMQNLDVPEWLSKSFFFWSWDPAPPIQYSTDFTY